MYFTSQHLAIDFFFSTATSNSIKTRTKIPEPGRVNICLVLLYALLPFY